MAVEDSVDSLTMAAMLFDNKLLSALPTLSRAKAERLASEHAAAAAIYNSASDREQEARQRWQARHLLVERQIADRDLLASWTRDDDVAAVRAANVRGRASVEPLRREHQAALDARDRAAVALTGYAFLLDVAQWLERTASRGVRLEHRPLPPVMSTVKAVLLQEIERVRQELARLDKAWRQAEAAPSPRDDFRARAIAEIEALAEKGALAIDLRRRGPNPIGLADRIATDMQPLDAGEGKTVSRLAGDLSAFHVWLNKDAILERINQLIDATDDSDALSHEAREQAFGGIRAERLALEFQEEAAIIAARNSGMQIARRRDADPRAVLEVAEP